MSYANICKQRTKTEGVYMLLGFFAACEGIGEVECDSSKTGLPRIIFKVLVCGSESTERAIRHITGVYAYHTYFIKLLTNPQQQQAL